jgi:hypothetical protein
MILDLIHKKTPTLVEIRENKYVYKWRQFSPYKLVLKGGVRSHPKFYDDIRASPRSVRPPVLPGFYYRATTVYIHALSPILPEGFGRLVILVQLFSISHFFFCSKRDLRYFGCNSCFHKVIVCMVGL